MPAPADPFAPPAGLPGVEAAVAAARSSVDRLAALAVLRSAPERIRTEMALRGARASAALAGFEVDLADVRSGAALDLPCGSVLRGALRVSAELGPALATWARAPRQALARLHALAAADELPGDALGRPVSAAAAARLDLLAGALAVPSRTPAIVVAAIVHGELLSAVAFGTGSAVVARGASRLVLMSGGVDPAGVAAIEVGHAGLGLTEYQKALDGYVSGGGDGIAAWIRHCASALALAAAQARDVGKGLS